MEVLLLNGTSNATRLEPDFPLSRKSPRLAYLLLNELAVSPTPVGMYFFPGLDLALRRARGLCP